MSPSMGLPPHKNKVKYPTGFTFLFLSLFYFYDFKKKYFKLNFFITYMLIILFIYYARAALKVIPPVLLCWPMTSEVDVSGCQWYGRRG